MKLIGLFIFLILPFSVSASDIQCGGTVTIAMDSKECDGNYAFKTTGSQSNWICPKSDKGNAITLAALVSGKKLGVYIDDAGATLSCTNMPHYTSARYVVIYP